jgi:hypothetical protein
MSLLELPQWRAAAAAAVGVLLWLLWLLLCRAAAAVGVLLWLLWLLLCRAAAAAGGVLLWLLWLWLLLWRTAPLRLIRPLLIWGCGCGCGPLRCWWSLHRRWRLVHRRWRLVHRRWRLVHRRWSLDREMCCPTGMPRGNLTQWYPRLHRRTHCCCWWRLHRPIPEHRWRLHRHNHFCGCC